MDVYPNAVAVSGSQVTSAGFQPEMIPFTANSSMPAEFLPGENAEGGDDANLEWLSMFMEDCLSSTPSYTTIPQPHPLPTTAVASNPPPQLPIERPLQPMARAKRTKLTPRTPQNLQVFNVTPSDPPMLHQTYWLADSELVFPKRTHELPPTVVLDEEKRVKEDSQGDQQQQQQARRCSHCHSQKTPQWRAGPLGPKTLCNACGVRFKSGRLLPEYRPAKSPTFVSYKHSNSHKKVLEMRMALLSSHSK